MMMAVIVTLGPFFPIPSANRSRAASSSVMSRAVVLRDVRNDVPGERQVLGGGAGDLRHRLAFDESGTARNPGAAAVEAAGRCRPDSSRFLRRQGLHPRADVGLHVLMSRSGPGARSGDLPQVDAEFACHPAGRRGGGERGGRCGRWSMPAA